MENTKKDKKVRLDNIRQVKRFLQSIINDYNNDLIADSKAKTMSTLLNTYIKIFSEFENEVRIEAIEKQLGISANE